MPTQCITYSTVDGGWPDPSLEKQSVLSANKLSNVPLCERSAAKHGLYTRKNQFKCTLYFEYFENVTMAADSPFMCISCLLFQTRGVLTSIYYM